MKSSLDPEKKAFNRKEIEVQDLSSYITVIAIKKVRVFELLFEIRYHKEQLNVGSVKFLSNVNFFIWNSLYMNRQFVFEMFSSKCFKNHIK